MGNRIACLSAMICMILAPTHLGAVEKQSDFISLFDGETLKGWHAPPGAYAVENGAIVCVEGRTGNLLSEQEYSNFVLRFEFKLTAGANNGLGIRCPLKPLGSLAYEGTELQILDNSAERYKTIKPYQYHGSVYGIIAAKPEGLKSVGEWNKQEVTVEGRQIKVILNDRTIVDANLDVASTPATLDGVDHPGLKRAKGHLGFLGHGSRIEIRKILIRELPNKQ